MDAIDANAIDRSNVSFPRKFILRLIFLRESVYAPFYQFS